MQTAPIKIRAATRLLTPLLLAALATLATAAPISVCPAHSPDFTQSLSGTWSFKYLPTLTPGPDDADFHSPTFNTSTWKTIPVPSNWELQGFADPHYDLKLQDGLGLYRRTFRIPATWRTPGRRTILRFEGVAFGFDAWVNGTKIGSSTASAYNPHTFDITDALKPDPTADNLLAVQVTTKPLAWEFDVNDDWALSGIYRDVTLFSVPATHLQDLSTHTTLSPDGSADLHIAVTVNQAGAQLHGKLLSPDNHPAADFDLQRKDNGPYEAVIHIPHPHLWTAETPSLYHLQLTLSSNNQPLQTVDQRIGLREITTTDGILKLNGHPIKLRGVDRHDEAPDVGRATTEEHWRRDLDLMRRANVNFVRTSHYPPNQRFLELCDELGFYVMCEVPIGKGENHDNDPAYRDSIFARTDATITRDKNHASVIVWSIGNENPITDLLLDAGRHAKDLDPSRPICYPTIGSYFQKNYQKFPDFVDIYSPHYPTNPTLREYAKSLTRPTILTEYAHALGLATDRVQAQWDLLQSTPHFAGGAIWHLMDQGLLRTSPTPVDRNKPTDTVWLDPTHLYDTHGNDGCDGITYSDRTPQTDFWEVRKVYSPVQIPETAAPVTPGTHQDLPLTIENRYDFRPLTGLKLTWSLRRNTTELQHGTLPLHAPAHDKETLHIPVDIPADATANDDVLTLNLHCTDEHGIPITEPTIQLTLPSAHRNSWPSNLPNAGNPTVTETESEIIIQHPHWTLTIARPTGALTIRDPAGHVLVSGIYPHPSRKLTMAEARAASKSNTWRPSTLTNLTDPKIDVTHEGSITRLTVAGRYPRPGAPDQSFTGHYQADISPSGAITLTYDYTPTHAKGTLTEAGLSLALPPDLTEFRWIGQGPYPGYPGKDRLNESGLFHLTRDDLRFQGNRRQTELALLTTPTGTGIAIATYPSDISVERDADTTLLSHNALISGLGNKGTTPETTIDSSKSPHITGTFTLLPLTPPWPAPLTRWFGPPTPAHDVFHPFYHSYDQ